MLSGPIPEKIGMGPIFQKKGKKRAKKGKIFENSRMYEATRTCLGYNDISIKWMI